MEHLQGERRMGFLVSMHVVIHPHGRFHTVNMECQKVRAEHAC